MAKSLANAQIDRLGDRLRKGPATEEDLRLLETFKRSFGPAYQTVLEMLQKHCPSVKGRPEKSTLSIVAKLHRENTRLSRMQDIAGCRIIARNIIEQDALSEIIKKYFPKALIKDRRKTPSHGYRAIHLIAESNGRLVEIQIRTELQHSWAELSEKAADALGIEIKYGGGNEFWRHILTILSDVIRGYESTEILNPHYEKLDRESEEAARQFIAENPECVGSSGPGIAIRPEELFAERVKIMEIVHSLMLLLEKEKKGPK